MEALAAVSLAGNILQFIDFAAKVLDDAITFYASQAQAQAQSKSDSESKLKSKVEAEYQDAGYYAKHLQRLAERVMTPERPTGGKVSKEEEELRELSVRCSEISKELLSATEDLTESSHHDLLQSGKKAIKVHLRKDRISSLQNRLDRISQQLTSELIQTQITKVDKMLDKIAKENFRLSARRDKDIYQLQKQLRHVTELLEKGGNQSETFISLSGLAENGPRITEFTAEQLILGRLFFHGMNERHANVQIEHVETLSWIFNESSSVRFVQFLESESSLYWVSGKPGSGKSTAMKYICNNPATKQHLNQWAGRKRLLVTKFFFWSGGRLSLLKSQEGLLRSMLYQILREAPELIPHSFPEDWAACLSGTFLNPSSKSGTFSIAELLTAIQLLCTRLPKDETKMCIFVDGLDEYEGRPDDVIKLITSLKSSPNVKACVSSRPWNEFEKVFGRDKTNKLYMQDLTKGDIRKYVRDTLEEDETFQELVHSEGEAVSMALVHDIVDAAQGVFLWVRLVVRSLLEGLTNADKVSNLQRRLRSIPTDLDEYFERILFSVDDFYSRQAAVMCLITLAAKDTLPLLSYWFMDENEKDCRYAINLKVQRVLDDLVEARLKKMEKRLNAYCKGLLEPTYVSSGLYEEQYASIGLFNHRVDFLHRTVRDFLKISRTQNLLLERVPETFNADMAICLALLAQIKVSPHEGILFVDCGPVARLVRLILNHLGALEVESIPLETEMEIFDQLGATLKVQADVIGAENYQALSPRATFLSACAERGASRYVCKVLKGEPKPTFEELCMSLSSTASATDLLGTVSQQQIIQVLLREGADPNYRSVDSQQTPWGVFLDSILAGYQNLSEEGRSVVYRILIDYLDHGAALLSIRSESNAAALRSIDPQFGGRIVGFKTMMQTVLTQEEIDKLISRAKAREKAKIEEAKKEAAEKEAASKNAVRKDCDTNGNTKKKSTNCFGRISRIWTFLKRRRRNT